MYICRFVCSIYVYLNIWYLRLSWQPLVEWDARIIPQWTIGIIGAITKCFIRIKLSHKIKQQIAFNNWLDCYYKRFSQAMRDYLASSHRCERSLNLNLNCFIPTSNSTSMNSIALTQILSFNDITLSRPRMNRISFSSRVQQICKSIYWDQSWICSFRALVHLCLRRHNKRGV